MRILRTLLLASGLVPFSLSAAHAQVNVVASIKPIHSIVASVMEGVGKPNLILEGASSPHTYSMKPSKAKLLEKADLIFWVGKDIESFLVKPLNSIGSQAKSVSLIETHGLNKLKFREGGDFDAHDHDHGHDDHKDHGHDKHEKHGHDDHKDHGHEKHGHDDHKDHGHDEHKEHAHKEHGHDGHHDEHSYDPHIWLDPQAVKVLAHEIEETLSKEDPKNAATYEANAQKLIAKLDTLTKQTTDQLKDVSDKKFIVFHDAYNYFEKRFDLTAAGSITVSPEILPGAKRVKELHHKIEKLGATCVFSEPQFEPKIVKTLVRGTNAKTGVLDPLGADLKQGPNHYFELIGNMAKSFKKCLSSS